MLVRDATPTFYIVVARYPLNLNLSSTHTTHMYVVQCTQSSKHTIDDNLHASYMLTMPIYFACGTERSGMHGMRALVRK